MPTVLSMCHGGICRAPTREAIALAHGRASSYVISDIGAMLSGRWHPSHFCWKMGATSFVNVTVFAVSAAAAGIDETRRALKASAVETRNITGSFRLLVDRSLISDIIRICRHPEAVSLCLFFGVHDASFAYCSPIMRPHAPAAAVRTV